MNSTVPPKQESFGRAALRVLKVIAWVIGGMFALVMALYGYQSMDEDGWFSHDRTLDVYMSSNWMVGENRICSLGQSYDANGKPTGKLASLECPVGDEKLEPHNLTVTFKGMIDAVDLDGNPHTIPDQWKCTRGSDSFICTVVKATR